MPHVKMEALISFSLRDLHILLRISSDHIPDSVRSVFLTGKGEVSELIRRIRFKGGLKCVYCGSSEVRKD